MPGDRGGWDVGDLAGFPTIDGSGTPPIDLTAKDKAAIARLRRMGWSVTGIARQLGLAIGAVETACGVLIVRRAPQTGARRR